MKTQLLCTFTKKNKLTETIKDIQDTYNVLFNRIFVLENLDNKAEALCTYNVESGSSNSILRNTISVHRNKETNTLYTINALNHVVALLNNGEADPNFSVDWSKFRNILLVTDDYGLKKIKTKVFNIINL